MPSLSVCKLIYFYYLIKKEREGKRETRVLTIVKPFRECQRVPDQKMKVKETTDGRWWRLVDCREKGLKRWT